MVIPEKRVNCFQLCNLIYIASKLLVEVGERPSCFLSELDKSKLWTGYYHSFY